MNLASLAQLPYLEAVIQETSRTAPPVPLGLLQIHTRWRDAGLWLLPS